MISQKKIKKKINIVWFKRDLRSQDHLPLKNAEDEKNDFLCIYIFDKELINSKDCSIRHLQFVYHSILDLNNTLNKYNQKIHVFYANTLKVFEFLNEVYLINNIYSYQETGIFKSWEIDKEVLKFCLNNTINWVQSQRDGIIRGIKSRKNWDKLWYSSIEAPIIKNKFSVSKISFDSNIYPIPKSLLLKIINYPKEFQPAGQSYAKAYLRSFTKFRGKNYSKHISKPLESRYSCSRLSVYLSWGNISSKQVYHFIKNHPNYKSNKKSYSGLLSRIKWRCHFIQKFEVEPEYEFRCINKGYENLTYSNNIQLINSWKNGTTGIPLIDACMRCLKITGWINFRMRAMLVSVFCHHFDCNWKNGVFFLARLFLDYEPGIHFTQFQMQAGVTGINAIRIYNPIKQSIDHDNDGLFIKKWVKELKLIPKQFIHEPWKITPMDKIFYGINFKIKSPQIDLIKSSQLARKKLWSNRKKLLVKNENKRIINTHTRNSMKKNKDNA